MQLSAYFCFASFIVATILALAAPIAKPSNKQRWVFALGMLALAAESLFTGLGFRSNHFETIGSYQQLRLVATAFVPGFWLLFVAIYTRGSIRNALSQRALILLPALIAPPAIGFYFKDSLVLLNRSAANANGWIATFTLPSFVIHIALLLSSVAIVTGLERAFRASVGTMRWKIKFMLYGVGTIFIARFFTSSHVILFKDFSPYMDTMNAIALLIGCVLVFRSLFREGSFEIVLYPSSAVLRNSLTTVLAGGYLVIVGVVAKIISQFGGESALAIKIFIVVLALVLLGIVLQSDRFRQDVRRFVSRHFHRPLYDYRTLWRSVTEATSQSVERSEICRAMTRLLVEMFDTKMNSIWFLNTDNGKFQLAASSEQGLEGKTSFIEAKTLSPYLRSHPDPFSIDKRLEAALEEIDRLHESKFPDGGHRICVPLIEREAIVGFMILGDRTGGLRFTTQELDTLQCIGAHLAATLHASELSQKVAANTEVEAFQTMATFFVHDLKNAVSTLNLMLKNIPKHWDNPEFREDALKSLGGTSNRITQLISRLGNMRAELEIHPSRQDLKDLLDQVLRQWAKPQGINLTCSIPEGIEINVDREKIQSVLTNLIINASEAMNENGDIQVTAKTSTNACLITVADTGPGMSDDFILNSLFRPFKTTKKTGLGIGMFQSKMTIEAHGGKIQVDSSLGRGTTFTLSLPRHAPPATP